MTDRLRISFRYDRDGLAAQIINDFAGKGLVLGQTDKGEMFVEFPRDASWTSSFQYLLREALLQSRG